MLPHFGGVDSIEAFSILIETAWEMFQEISLQGAGQGPKPCAHLGGSDKTSAHCTLVRLSKMAGRISSWCARSRTIIEIV